MKVPVVDAWTALSDPTRREVFARLVRTPQSVTALAADLPVSRPAVSQHLRLLKQVGLVQLTASGREHIYRARLVGLEELRAELDGFWASALANFKQIAESETGPRREGIDDER